MTKFLLKSFTNISLFIISIFVAFTFCEILFRILVKFDKIDKVMIIDPYIYKKVSNLTKNKIPNYYRGNNASIKPQPYESHDLLGTILKANAISHHVSSRDNLNNMIYTNELGIRSDKFKKYNNLNSCDFVFAGDSFTFGYGVNFEETFSFHFSKNLKNTVLSIGNPGYGTIQQFIYVKELLNKMSCSIQKFTLVYMINDFENDISFIKNKPERLKKIFKKYQINFPISKSFIYNKKANSWQNSNMKWWRFIFDERVDLHEKKSTPFFGLLINDFIHYSHLLTYLYLHNLNSPELFGDQTFSSIYLSKDTEENKYFRELHYLFLKRLIKEIQEHNIKFNVVIVPARYEVNNYWFERSLSPYELNSNKYSVDIAYKKVIDFFKNQGVAVLDGRDAFKKLKKDVENFYFKYDGHFNKQGNLQFSSWLRDHLFQIN